jgi:hypothetical protein
MAISTSRVVTLLLLLVAATACYALGFASGFWLLIAAGAILELVFWFKVVRSGKHR